MATQTRPAWAPEHVPDKLLWDHSLTEYNSELDDPFMAASRLLDGPPIFFARDTAQGRPAWVLARHALISEAFIDWERFSSEGGMAVMLMQMLGVDWTFNPVNIDPPKHTAYRKLLLPHFTPKAVGHMEQGVRETCDELIAPFAEKGGCDFVKDFAVPFPSVIFLRLMGMPQDMMQQFFTWEQNLLRGKNIEEMVVAGREILEYLKLHLEKQKKKPATPLMEAIMSARIDGKPLNDGEILGMFYTFYTGGLDTVYGTLGWSMRYIATHPEFQQWLRDNPDKLNKAVDELLRMFSVVMTQRRVSEDMTFHGVQMKQDDLVFLPIFVAGRDPEAYPDPHVADPDRKQTMLAFATGPHLCLGLHLARREIRIALESFLARFDNIHIPDDVQYQFHAGPTLNVDSLPLAWTKKD
ncbi:MAG: cytochrome P450 [Novosphingobium sp.]|nr:cytochrome P450 [Novosphingobium sp.]